MRSMFTFSALTLILTLSACRTSTKDATADVKDASSEVNERSCGGYHSNAASGIVDNHDGFEVYFREAKGDGKAKVTFNENGRDFITFDSKVSFNQATGIRTYRITNVAQVAANASKGGITFAETKLSYISSVMLELEEYSAISYGNRVEYPGTFEVTKTDNKINKFRFAACKHDL